MKSRYITIAVLFIVFFFMGYVVMGYTRHYIYEERIQQYQSECIAWVAKGIEKPMGWEDFPYSDSPEAAHVIADPVFQNEIYSLYEDVDAYYCEYQTEVFPPFLSEFENHTWSLWDAYKGWVIFYYELGGIHAASGSIHIGMGPHHSEDWGGSLAESIVLWEAAGGNCQGTWIEIYKKSPEYQDWLNQVLTEIAALRETPLYEWKGLEEYYIDSREPLELPFWTSLFCKDILEAEQRMIEIAHSQYVQHVADKDIVRSGIDARIIQFRGSLLDSAAVKGYDTLYILRSRKFPFRDLTIDGCIMIGFSIVSTFFVVKKILPQVEQRE